MLTVSDVYIGNLTVGEISHFPTKSGGMREPISALNQVTLKECDEPLVNLRSYCPYVCVARTCLPLLRVSVAQKLNSAQELLPPGYQLWVRTALRTLERQRVLYETYSTQLRDLHPEWSHSTLRRAANRFFAPTDQKAPPGHCTGGAVDVKLLSPHGKLVDVLSPYTGWQAAPTWVTGLTPRAQKFRLILVQSMLDAGFSNCQDEYWHYSYGDAAWAVRTGTSYCIYGLIEAPAKWRSFWNR